MAYFLGVLIFVVGLAVSIGLHEMGHLIPAKRFGVRVSNYMIGFGPTLWSRTSGETEYGVKAIPLGGYVRLVGMIPPASEVKPLRGTGWAPRIIEETRLGSVDEILPGEEGRAFYRLTWWKRVVVMAGGPMANLLIAVILFTAIGLFYGEPTTVPTVSNVSACILPAGEDRECSASDPVTAAAAAGLQVGDTIIAADGTEFPIWVPLTQYIRAHPGKTMTLTVLRDGAEITVIVTPTAAERAIYDDTGAIVLDAAGKTTTEVVGFLGVSPTQTAVRQNLWYGAKVTGTYLGLTMHAIAKLPHYVANATETIFGNAERDQQGVMSIVGAGRVAGEIAQASDAGLRAQIAGFLGLLAGMNLALFGFNMIPLPPLDGGHIAGALWQGVKDGWAKAHRRARPRPVDLARLMPATYVMFALLVVMGVLMIAVDIISPLPLG